MARSDTADESVFYDAFTTITKAINEFRTSDDLFAVVITDAIRIGVTVAVLAAVLYGVTGVWPPFAAVESGSMQPTLERGDLVITVDEEKSAPSAAHGDTGVVTARAGERADYRTFGGPGNVILYSANGTGQTIIHRARFWVAEGENWYHDANMEYIKNASNCTELQYCPAPHAGFITKGDANRHYDQVTGISEPVKPEWIISEAKYNAPSLGYLRLLLF
ncbi:S26 family signal peptidase [Salinibaculum rarum]|uniref:S26 family signal peptidase n=1 Tax=Salinibaculum rarum TaxID=3058903 RepID=UPI00265F9449|nr:S26 family signal peptidase [Salinibaculum sp. KK48]